jgi:hypothetical protein
MWSNAYVCLNRKVLQTRKANHFKPGRSREEPAAGILNTGLVSIKPMFGWDAFK